VKQNYYGPDAGAGTYDFTLGELVFIRFVYDLDAPPITPTSTARIAVEISSEFGFRRAFSSSGLTRSSGSEAGGVLRLNLDFDPIHFALSLGESFGTIAYTRDGGAGNEGFDANLTRVPDASLFPAPEPSTLAMGAIGAGVLALAGMRRRKAA
jgi:PEP-CTERM motif